MDNFVVNIAFLLSDIAHGGASKSAFLLIKSLDKSKYNIHVFVKNPPRDQKLLNEFKLNSQSINLIDVPSIYSLGKYQQNTNPFKSALVYMLYRKKIQNFIFELKNNNIDLIHLNSTQFAYLAPVIKSELGIKVVCHVRELVANRFNTTFKFVSNCIENFSDAIICISPNEAAFLKNYIKVHIVANPFDFKSIKMTGKKNISGQYIGMLGSFIKAKRADLFLEAIKILKIKHPEFPYKFAILGAARKPLWKLIANIIVFWNFFPFQFQTLLDSSIIRDDIILLPLTDSIQDFFNSLLIYVRPDGHPWGRDIIEAMAYGVPVVANGTSDFFIKHGTNGFLAKPDDPDDLAEKIILLTTNSQLQKVFIYNASQLVRKKCDLAQYAKIIQEIYETC